MKRFQKFFGATLLTSLFAISTFADGNMGFPANGNMGFPTAGAQRNATSANSPNTLAQSTDGEGAGIEATTEIFINVLQNIFLMF